jgi:hypothetical protein
MGATLKTKTVPRQAVPVVTPQGINFILKSEADWDLDKINVKTLDDLFEDPYATAVFNKLTNLIFQDPYTVEIKDPDGNVNEELSKFFQQMLDAPDVQLWQQMKICFGAWFWYGPYLASLGIDFFDGMYILSAIVDLPPASFSENNATGTVLSVSRILHGIVKLEDKKTHYYQQQEIEIVELNDIFHIKPPGYGYDIAGLPLIFPLIKSFKKMGFAWLAQMQCVNRAGAPSIFLKITKPIKSADGKRDDWRYGNEILKNYGKNNLYPIYENFDPIEVVSNVTDVSLKTIELLTKVIIYQFSTSDLVAKDGTLIGGSNSAEKELLTNFIKGFHTSLKNGFEPVTQKFLEYNGFLGHKVVINIPTPEFTDEKLELDRAIEGRNAKDIHPNEHRKKLGLPPKSDEELVEIRNAWLPTEEEQAYQAEQFQQKSSQFGQKGNGEKGEKEDDQGIKKKEEDEKKKNKGGN